MYFLLIIVVQYYLDPTATPGSTLLSYALGYRQFNENILKDMKEVFDNPVKVQQYISIGIYENHLSYKNLQLSRANRLLKFKDKYSLY